MTPQIFRWTYGYLIREIFDHMSAKIDGTLSPNRAMFIYSAHDMNIASILNIFSLFAQFGYRAPPYASSLHFDLYKTKDNQHYMQLTYRYDNKPKLLKFPGCGTNCSMEDLRRMYNEIIPTAEFEEECRLPFHIRLIEGYNVFGPDDGKQCPFFIRIFKYSLRNGICFLLLFSRYYHCDKCCCHCIDCLPYVMALFLFKKDK